MIKATENTNANCTLCDHPASASLHDPKYGSHLFVEAAPASETSSSDKHYYVAYWSPVEQTVGYYFHKGEIETEQDIERLVLAIGEATGALLAKPINWKRIS